jgi:hypothetical protein
MCWWFMAVIFFGEGHDFDIPLEKLGEGGKMEGKV